MKGQSGLEFLSMISLSMLILAGLHTLMLAKQQDTINFQEKRNAEFIAEKTSFQVEMALVQGEGYSRVFSLPPGIGGSNYTLELEDSSVELEWGQESLYRLSRYRGDPINISVSEKQQVFRVLHNSSGVFIVEK